MLTLFEQSKNSSAMEEKKTGLLRVGNEQRSLLMLIAGIGFALASHGADGLGHEGSGGEGSGEDSETSSGNGYDLLYRSNSRTWSNESLQFERPLPAWINGDYFQIGPGLFETDQRKVTHAFDGFAKLNKVTFRKGQAWYSNQFLHTDYYKKSMEDHDLAAYLLFAQPEPPFSFWQKLRSFTRGLDNMNVNINRFGDKFVAMTDIWQVYAFDPDTLDTVEKISAPIPPEQPYLNALPSTAHPVQEPCSPNLITFVSILNPFPPSKSHIKVVRITSARERQLVATISRDWNRLPYMHSLAVSQHYAVIFAHPAFIDAMKVGSGNLINVLAWEAEVPTDVYVVRLEDGHVTKMETETHFFVHHVNSYELEGNQLVIDYTVYSTPELLRGLTIETQLNSTLRDDLEVHVNFKRFVIDMTLKTISVFNFEETSGAEAANHLDLPVINPIFAHKKHRYIYGVSLKADNEHYDHIALAKKDVSKAGNDKVWWQANHYPQEPFFLATPNRKKEDRGILMSIILDGDRGKSYIGVFNPSTMRLVNKAYLPDSIPVLIHGHYFPAD